VELNITAVNENMNAILFGLVEPSWFKDIPNNDIGMHHIFFINRKNLNNF